MLDITPARRFVLILFLLLMPRHTGTCEEPEAEPTYRFELKSQNAPATPYAWRCDISSLELAGWSFLTETKKAANSLSSNPSLAQIRGLVKWFRRGLIVTGDGQKMVIDTLNPDRQVLRWDMQF